MDRRISRNHGSSQNDERNGSQKKRAQFHMELPLNQPLLRAVYKLDAAYPAQRVFATRYFPDVPRLVPPPVSLNVHQNILAFYPQRKHINLDIRQMVRQSRPRMERPRMPRTNNRVPLQPSLSQRTGADRHCLALTTLHSHSPGTLPPVDLRLRNPPHRRRIRQPTQPHPLRHVILSRPML
jgi:hypothetical protein